MYSPHWVSRSATISESSSLPSPRRRPDARAANDVRGLAHVLHPAREGDPRLAEADHLHRGDDGLDAGAAEPVHGERGHLDGQPRLEADVAGAVDRVARGLQGVAHDHVVDPRRLHARPLERGAGRVGAQLQRGHVLERADVLGHRRAGSAQDDHVLCCHENELREREKKPNHTMRLTVSRAAHSLPLNDMRMARTCVVSAVVAAAFVAGCGRTYDNPFAGSQTDRPAVGVGRDRVHEQRAQPAARHRPRGLRGGGVGRQRDPPHVLRRGRRRVLHPGGVLRRRPPARRRAPGPRRHQLRRPPDRGRRRGPVPGRLRALGGGGCWLPAPARPRVDWSTISDVIVYSGAGAGAQEDIFRMDPNGQNNRNISETAGHPRAPPPRRPDRDRSPCSSASTPRARARSGCSSPPRRSPASPPAGPPARRCRRRPYVVGSDADPDYSPDGRTIVFRRLRALGDGRLGQWDLMTVRTDGTGLTTIVSGPAFRDAPDWGPRGHRVHRDRRRRPQRDRDRRPRRLEPTPGGHRSHRRRPRLPPLAAVGLSRLGRTCLRGRRRSCPPPPTRPR